VTELQRNSVDCEWCVADERKFKLLCSALGIIVRSKRDYRLAVRNPVHRKSNSTVPIGMSP